MTDEVSKKDELIVSGYIHQCKLNIPVEIIQLCLKWYHVAFFFEFYPSVGKIMNDEKTIIKFIKPPPKRDEFVSIYSSITMPSKNNNSSIYEYDIRLHGKLGVVVGICDAKFIDTDTFFYDEKSNHSSYYALYGWNGWIIQKESHGSMKYAVPYNYTEDTKDTEMKIIYDTHNETLSYTINGKDYGIACKPIHRHETLSYRLAIHLDLDSLDEMTVELKHFRQICQAPHQM